jgi:hypothetical protein
MFYIIEFFSLILNKLEPLKIVGMMEKSDPQLYGLNQFMMLLTAIIVL